MQMNNSSSNTLSGFASPGPGRRGAEADAVNRVATKLLSA